MSVSLSDPSVFRLSLFISPLSIRRRVWCPSTFSFRPRNLWILFLSPSSLQLYSAPLPLRRPFPLESPLRHGNPTVFVVPEKTLLTSLHFQLSPSEHSSSSPPFLRIGRFKFIVSFSFCSSFFLRPGLSMSSPWVPFFRFRCRRDGSLLWNPLGGRP